MAKLVFGHPNAQVCSRANSARVTDVVASSRSDTGQRIEELEIVQLAHRRVNSSKRASVTMQSLAAVKTRVIDASY